MSRTASPSGGRPYGLARVCRVWRAARSTVYRHRAPPPTRPTGGEALESARLKARLGEMLLERELLEAKIAALEARGPGPLARRRPRP